MSFHLHFTGFEQYGEFGGKPFIPRIYEGIGDPPKGFNAVILRLDASERSLLDWRKEIENAQRYLGQGLKILWELDFSSLEGALEEEGRFLSLQIAIQHFNEKVWSYFKSDSLGVVLYRGYLNNDDILDFLKSLAASLEEEATCFVMLDTSPAKNAWDFFQLINQERFGHLQLILKGPFAKLFPWAVPSLAWGHSLSPLGFCSDVVEKTLQSQSIPYAVCLPISEEKELLEKAIQALDKQPFRILSENLLIQECEGIDRVIVFPKSISEKGRRQLKGFEAAGGSIICYPDDAEELRLQETFPPLSSHVF